MILRVENLHKRFGGVHALRGAELEVAPGEVHALMGENGSGKSTLLRIVAAQLRPDSGRILYDGDEPRFANPMAALRSGIVSVTQERTLALDLTVAENIFLGRRMKRGRLGIDWRGTERAAEAILERLHLDLSPVATVGRLRPDQQQMIEIARAISMDARVLILDEPTSSLTDDEVESLFAVVRRLRNEGIAIIFVSHRLAEAVELADRVTVLRDGVTVASEAMSSLDKDQLISLMVGGGKMSAELDRRPGQDGAPRLRVERVNVPGAVHDVSFEVRGGEIVGIAGLVGAGRSELLESLFGLHSDASGVIEIDGRRLWPQGPRDASAAGLAFVPADRKEQGLVPYLSVRENLTMALTSRRPRLARPDVAAERALVARVAEEMRLRAASPDVPVWTLSGGNQQKCVLAKSLITEPRAMILDEPTRGVDVGAKAEIYELLADIAGRGIAVLISSSETPELLAVCDRILVMFRGRVVASLAGEEANEVTIASYATGNLAQAVA